MKPPVLRLYGRQKTRALKPAQQELMDQLLPNISVSTSELSKKSGPILEIGFGSGEHLVHLATQSPETFFVGCEPFINGVAALLIEIDDKDLTNISIHHGDARHIFDELPDGLFSAVYLLYPDPWPKKRHFKRRFIQQESLALIHRLLVPKGKFYIASDHETYQTWIEEHLTMDVVSATFDWSNKTTKETPWDNWTRTRYEEKAYREGRTPRYYVLNKK
ncbi:MAG: tRNA (guanosine(46)-N7)-methyltransferase TrmB [Candidatus Paracaedibacteraceae bacterium]|nr:tRNA (guanosine(46)-N7)-methyltransferase TrmB [Candidatus Paracaedibacteraceae bacterium]